MFRFKANQTSDAISEERSKITRLPSGDSLSSRGGMDPGKDSWVFSKESQSSRKQRYSNTREHLPSCSYPPSDGEDYRANDSKTPVDENLKINVLYRGMVYRIRGLKIICSILAGIVLLLVALLILGIWIIIGTKQEGMLYFPWSPSARERLVNDNNEIETLHFNVPSSNLTMAGDYSVSLEPNGRTSNSSTDPNLGSAFPSQEVGEAIGHMQAAQPRSSFVTLEPKDGDDGSKYNNGDEYYDEYEDYQGDSNVEYSLQHPTFVDPSIQYLKPKHNELESGNFYVPENGGNNFRVHLNEPTSSHAETFDKPPAVPSDEITVNQEFYFKPSRRMPEYESLLINASNEKVVEKDSNFANFHHSYLEIAPTSHPNISRRQFTNAHFSHQNTDTAQLNTFENNQYSKQNTVEYINEDDHYRYPQVVQYDEIIIAREPQHSPLYFEPDSEENPLNRERQRMFSDSSDNRRLVTVEQHPSPGVAEEQFSEYEEQSEEYDDDPHRRLFVGSYDSSQIILESDLEKVEDMDIKQKSPIDTNISFYSLTSHLPLRINAIKNNPVLFNPLTNNAPPLQVPKSEFPYFEHLTYRGRHPTLAVRRRHLPGTINPIPHIRRSQISEGFLPRMNQMNADYHSGPGDRDFSGTDQRSNSVASESLNYRTNMELDKSSPLRSNRMPFNFGNLPRTFELTSGPYRIEDRPQFTIQSPIQRTRKEKGFFTSLKKMYDYSSRIATSLTRYSDETNLDLTKSANEFLKNSLTYLVQFSNVFHNLPQILLEPLNRIQLPKIEQIESLDPVELSLLTWTFIDFWEFLIEKVGKLSKEDLRTLEMRVKNLRLEKDTNMARAFIDAIPAVNGGSNNEEMEVVANTFFLSLLNETHNAEINKNPKKNTSVQIVKNMEINGTQSPNVLLKTGDGEIDPFNVTHDTAREGLHLNMAGTFEVFPIDEREKFIQYAAKTLFNFGKVYLRSDYAFDCMMLLFCKDINVKTGQRGMDGVAARLKSVGLKVLIDREGRETDTVTGVWRALTQWEALDCDAMFPKCDGSKALEIVNEVANASRR